MKELASAWLAERTTVSKIVKEVVSREINFLHLKYIVRILYQKLYNHASRAKLAARFASHHLLLYEKFYYVSILHYILLPFGANQSFRTSYSIRTAVEQVFPIYNFRTDKLFFEIIMNCSACLRRSRTKASRP